MIWIVSDHKPTADALLPLIADRGYQVMHVACDEDVRKRIRFATPILVIIDCGFPGSFDMLEIIRTEERGRHIPVVMYADDDPALLEKAHLKGADACVPKKSLDWESLFREIVRFAGPPPQMW